MPSDTYILTISDAGVSVPAANSVTNASVASDAAIAFSKLASLTSGNILVGNSSNVPTSVAVTGDITISNTGVTSIASGAVVDADINASAAIAHSKLATTTAGNVLLANSSGTITAAPITGDITINSSGVASIANDASIAFSKITPVTGDISISNSGVASIASGAIVNADINASAGISHSKLATTSAGNVLLGNNAGAITATPITGDITVSSSGISSITNDAVTFSKIQNISDYQILGRNSGTGIGDVQSISCTPFAFSLLNDGDAATARTTLGISTPAAGIVTSDGTNFSSVTVLPATNGGTGQSSYAVGDLLYANTTTSVAKLADIATGNVLLSGGLNTAPSYGKVGLSTHVTGILPLDNGGFGVDFSSQNGFPFYINGEGFTSYNFIDLTEHVANILPVANGGTNHTTIARGQISKMTAFTAVTIGTAGTYVTPTNAGTLDTATSTGTSLGATNTFSIKNTSGVTRIFRVYASADATSANNEILGIKLYSGTADSLSAIDATECRAFTSGTNAAAKLVTSWMVSLDNNQEVALYITNHSSTSSVNIQRARLIAEAVI